MNLFVKKKMHCKSINPWKTCLIVLPKKKTKKKTNQFFILL